MKIKELNEIMISMLQEADDLKKSYQYYDDTFIGKMKKQYNTIQVFAGFFSSISVVIPFFIYGTA